MPCNTSLFAVVFMDFSSKKLSVEQKI